MPVIFYQSNFCPECGNAKEKRRWLRNRYFCDFCAEKLSRKWDSMPLAFALCGLMLGAFFNFGRREVIREVAVNSPVASANLAAPIVSAQDATAQLKPAASLSAATFYCGARTKKGTPCKHRVSAPGEKCFQHQGSARKKR